MNKSNQRVSQLERENESILEKANLLADKLIEANNHRITLLKQMLEKPNG